MRAHATAVFVFALLACAPRLAAPAVSFPLTWEAALEPQPLFEAGVAAGGVSAKMWTLPKAMGAPMANRGEVVGFRVHIVSSQNSVLFGTDTISNVNSDVPSDVGGKMLWRHTDSHGAPRFVDVYF